jgi:uncharacterized protein (DUF433 family)
MAVLGFFTFSQVERLTGLSRKTISRWQLRGVFSPEHPKPLPLSGPCRRVFTFRDIVGLRTLKLLRAERHVDLNELQKVGAFLRRQTNTPWSGIRLWVVNGHVAFKDPATDLLLAGANGQVVADEIFLGEIARQVEQEAESFRQRDPETVGQVSRHRNVMSNQWVVAGTRIPTSVIREFHDAGYGIEAILAEYPDLTRRDIERALAHEASLTQTAA